VQHEACRKGKKEFNPLSSHEVSQISIERYCVPVVVFKESHAPSHGKTAREAIAKSCGSSHDMMGKWRFNNLNTKAVLSLREAVESSAHPGVGLCCSRE